MHYKLCQECSDQKHCEQTCKEANEFERQDNKSNYMKRGEYKPRGSVSSTWIDQRGSAGFGGFR